MMEAAELAAHGSVWILSEPSNQRHGRTAQMLGRHVDKWSCTADHPTTAKRSTRILRSCCTVQAEARGLNDVTSNARALGHV